jgi:hypothetical protein
LPPKPTPTSSTGPVRVNSVPCQDSLPSGS